MSEANATYVLSLSLLYVGALLMLDREKTDRGRDCLQPVQDQICFFHGQFLFNLDAGVGMWTDFHCGMTKLVLQLTPAPHPTFAPPYCPPSTSTADVMMMMCEPPNPKPQASRRNPKRVNLWKAQVETRSQRRPVPWLVVAGECVSLSLGVYSMFVILLKVGFLSKQLASRWTPPTCKRKEPSTLLTSCRLGQHSHPLRVDFGLGLRGFVGGCAV